MKSCVTISLVAEARGGPFVLWDDPIVGCRTAAELGYDAVEIFAPGPDAVDRRELRLLLEENDLALAAVGTGAGWVKHRLHLALPSETDRRRAIEFIRSMIDFGAEFGAPAIIGSMQGRSGPEVDRATARAHLCDALQELGEHAKQAGTVLIYEPLNRYETDQACTMADGVALLERLSTDSVVLLADLFHMGIEERSIAQGIRDGGKRIGHVHFVDSNRRPVGCGQTDFVPIIEELRRVDYVGYLSAEAFPWPDPLAAAGRTIDAFRWFTRRD
ncbi:MAG TPA: sugar phosphate isomerase [Planctomycetaceae bacterium]|nr:sugar phosphate isomerase [Planctomycetaceae bacterium]HRF01303.1 sugar phosphate isomerase/epimerase family protein [Pirellulaceae bacterium]